MYKNKKVVTCHAGARDGYHLSIAMEKAGLLNCLITDLFLPKFLGEFIQKKYSNELPFDRVKNIYSNVIKQKLFNYSYYETDNIISDYALKAAIKTNSNLFLYSYTAKNAFEYVKMNYLDTKCFLFQLHPHPISIRKLLNEELALVPLASNSILKEPEMCLDESYINHLNAEGVHADQIVVASAYTKKTLVENNISTDKISIIPYGVDSHKFTFKEKFNLQNGKIRLLFIGQMIQRKGLLYLFEALKMLNSKNIELQLIGRGVIDNTLIDEYRKYFTIDLKVNLRHDELLYAMHKCDLLVFPSLVEGFGHVILEAMSAGLPVLCTPNTAGPDVFVKGIEGVVVPIRNSTAIAEKIEYYINNKNELADMGESAAITARDFTWDRFQNKIVEFYLKNN